MNLGGGSSSRKGSESLDLRNAPGHLQVQSTGPDNCLGWVGGWGEGNARVKAYCQMFSLFGKNVLIENLNLSLWYFWNHSEEVSVEQPV